MKKKLSLFIIFLLSFIYLELVFKIMNFGIANLFSLSFIYYSLFSIIISLILYLICKSFSEKTNRRISLTIMFIICLVFTVEYVFRNIFNTFFSFSLLKIIDQALTFGGTAISETLKMLPCVILLFVPFIIMLIIRKKIGFEKHKKKKKVISYVVTLTLSILLFVLLANTGSNKALFYDVENNSLNFEKLGVGPSIYLDVKRLLFGFNEKIEFDSDGNFSKETINENGEKVTYEFNNLDIDFDKLINETNDSTIKNMHEYFKNDSGTLQNEYTKLFEGKNLVLVMAESLNTIAISEKYTPTLYKMANESFVFDNFYTPVNLSTIGGEFQNLTGLFANLNMLSTKWRKGTNSYPMGIAKLFKNKGYKAYAYHANSYNFQNRDVYLKSIGFDYYFAKGTGLEKKMNCNLWPQSDLDMINATYEDFIDNEEPFLAYFVSVSGHMEWSFSTNAMSRRYKDELKDSGYSEEAAAYIAANMDLDRAMKSLIDKLEEKGKLKDTVFAIVPDHYPYSMNINTINELSDFKRDEVIGVNKSTFILWNSETETKKIDKVSTQLDTLPTIYNLFNLPYDSRLIIGKDILSPSYEGLAFFTNRSWVTNKGTYYASNGKFVPNDGIEIEDNYVNKINKSVQNKINMSKYIIEKDYYRKVLGD